MSTSDCPQLTGTQRPSCYGCWFAINICGIIPVIPVADASNIDEASYTSDGSDWAIFDVGEGSCKSSGNIMSWEQEQTGDCGCSKREGMLSLIRLWGRVQLPPLGMVANCANLLSLCSGQVNSTESWHVTQLL